MDATTPPFVGIIPTGLPLITNPTSAPSQTAFLYTLPARPFSHIVVFLLPGKILPPGAAIAVYIQRPNSDPPFKFLGGVGPEKESAIFRIKGLVGGGNAEAGVNGGEVDMDAPETPDGNGGITLGISIEPLSDVESKMALLQSQTQQTQFSPMSTTTPTSSALVVANKPGAGRPDTLILAQRIIKNAQNFLASFSGNLANGVEVVPLKAFEEWMKKFEGRVRSDAGFLEREAD